MEWVIRAPRRRTCQPSRGTGMGPRPGSANRWRRGVATVAATPRGRPTAHFPPAWRCAADAPRPPGPSLGAGLVETELWPADSDPRARRLYAPLPQRPHGLA